MVFIWARKTSSGFPCLLGKDKIIGLSTHSPEQFKIAQDQDFDYCAFGPVFFTKTKSYYIGTNDLGEVFQMAKKPVICIGGITLRNVKKLVALGATNIAVIRAITEAGDIGMAVKSLKDALCT